MVRLDEAAALHMDDSLSKADEISYSAEYFGEFGAGRSPLVRSLLHFLFHRRVPRRRLDFGVFLISFWETKMRWYLNVISKFYTAVHAAAPCFFTRHGDNTLVFVVRGEESSRKRLQLPAEKKEFLETRVSEWRRQGGSFDVDESSLKEEELDLSYSLIYEGGLTKSGRKFHLFERVVFTGIDKVVFRATVPFGSDPEIIANVKKIAASLFVRPIHGGSIR